MRYALGAILSVVWGMSAASAHAQDNVPAIAYLNVLNVTVGTTSSVVIPAGLFRTAFQVCTSPASTTNVWLNPSGQAAVVGGGVPVYSGGACTNFGPKALPMPQQAVTAITDGASPQTLAVAGG